MDITPYIRDIPDFPQPGVVFKDISPFTQSKVSRIDKLSLFSHCLG